MSLLLQVYRRQGGARHGAHGCGSYGYFRGLCGTPIDGFRTNRSAVVLPPAPWMLSDLPSRLNTSTARDSVTVRGFLPFRSVMDSSPLKPLILYVPFPVPILGPPLPTPCRN